MKKTKNILAVFCALFLLSLAAPLNAQSTIWNTPSTDVQAAGTTYVEADFFAHFGAAERGGFRTYGIRTVYGARKNVEVGVNAFYNRAGDDVRAIEFQPNAKWNFFESEKRGLKAAAGFVAYLPANQLRGADAFGMAYSTFSQKIRAKFGPRLTGGGYVLVGRQKGTGDRAGFLAAYEQPLFPKVGFVADWYSGKNRFGYAGAGFYFALTKKSLFYVGYNAGNSGKGNNYLGAFYGRTF